MPFVGYPGAVWSVVYASFGYFITSLNNASSPGAVVPLAQTVYATCANALEALNINRVSQAWAAEYALLLEVEAAPISPPANIAVLVQNRVGALGDGLVNIQTLVPTITYHNIATLLNQNLPPISDVNYLSWLGNFSFETTPDGLTSDTFINTTETVSGAFSTIAGLIQTLETPALNSLYDVCIRFADTANVISNFLLGITSGPISLSLGSQYIWNQMATLPALLLDAFLITSVPYNIQVQQDMVIRYVILTIQQQLAQFLLIMRQPTTTTINQAQLLVGNSLMDVAAANTGNFENWANIATANGLLPPYTGPNTILASGIAGWGSELVLPNPGTSSAAIGTVPSYEINFLGVDLYTGPINGSMPVWNGDYQTIFGYPNLRWALGRRLQTTLGDLIYHSNYGSRIPPEVGRVQDNSTVGHIAAFGQAALQQDPRIARVLSAIAQSLPAFAVQFTGAVQPGGFGATPLELNEVISP